MHATPAHRIGGPVFAKELLETSRRRRYFLNRVLYTVALLIALLVIWDDTGDLHHYPVQIRALARFAHEVFVAVSTVQFAAVWFLVPIFTCGLISAEREAHTLDLLLTSQLSDREIVFGKLASRLAIVVQILLSTLPVLCLVAMFGGIELRAVLETAGATLLAMVFCGACAIYFSATTRSPVGALVRTYWWLSFFLIGLPTITVAIFELLKIGPSHPYAIILYAQFLADPITAFAVAVERRLAVDLAAKSVWWFYWPLYLIPATISANLLWRAVVRLRTNPERSLAARLTSWFLSKFARRFVDRHEVRAASLRVRAQRWWGMPVVNPIWLRARLARIYDREGYIGRIQWMGWLLAGAMFLLIALLKPRELADRDVAIAFLAPVWIALGLLATLISASSFVSDRRRGFLDLVLVTALDPREIVDGTFLAVWRHLRNTWWLAVTLTVLFVLIGAVGRTSPSSRSCAARCSCSQSSRRVWPRRSPLRRCPNRSYQRSSCRSL